MHSRRLFALCITPLVGTLSFVTCGDGGTGTAPASPAGSPQRIAAAPAGLTKAQSCGDLEARLKAHARRWLDFNVDQQIKAIRDAGVYCTALLYYAGDAAGDGDNGGDNVGDGNDADGEGESDDGGTSDDEVGEGSDGDGTSPAPPADESDEGRCPAWGDHHDDERSVHIKARPGDAGKAHLVEADNDAIYLLQGSNFLTISTQPGAPSVTRRVAIEGTPLEMIVARAGEGGPRRVVVYSFVESSEIYAAAGVKPGPQHTEYFSFSIAADDDEANCEGPAVDEPLTKVTVLDLPDGGPPKVVSEAYFEGRFSTAQPAGAVAHAVLAGGERWPRIDDSLRFEGHPLPAPRDVEAWVAAFEQMRERNRAAIDASTYRDWLPYSFVKRGGAVVAEQPACETYYVPGADTTEYGLTQIQSVDLASPEHIQSTAVVARAGTVYSNANSLYITGFNSPFAPAPPRLGAGGGADDVGDNEGDACNAPMAPSPPSLVRLHKFDLSNASPRPPYAASGTVEGNLNEELSLDEHNGLLRIMTTESVGLSRGGRVEEVNRLFVLKEAGGVLAEAGRAPELAQVQGAAAVRFVGPRAYVFTPFEKGQIFIFDLADPYAPKLLSRFSVPGFGLTARPLDDTHLLVINETADPAAGAGGDRRDDGCDAPTRPALHVFDVSDPTGPRPVHRFDLTDDLVNDTMPFEPAAFAYFEGQGLLAQHVADNRGPDKHVGPLGALEMFRVGAAGISHLGAVDHAPLLPPARRAALANAPFYMRHSLFIKKGGKTFVYSISDLGLSVADVAALRAGPVGWLDLSPYLDPPELP